MQIVQSTMGYGAERLRNAVEATLLHYHEAANQPSVVYFMGCGPHVKIGTSKNLLSRLETLRTHSPQRLDLLTICWGGMEQERATHARFEAHRLHSEWFIRCQEIEAFMAQHGLRKI